MDTAISAIGILIGITLIVGFVFLIAKLAGRGIEKAKETIDKDMNAYIKAEKEREELLGMSGTEKHIPFKERAFWQLFKEQEEMPWFKLGGAIFFISLIGFAVVGAIVWDFTPIYGAIISIVILILYFVIGLITASYRKKGIFTRDLIRKMFRVLYKKHYYPEILNDEWMVFKYIGRTFTLFYDKENEYCVLMANFDFENKHGIKKRQLQLIGYELMSEIRYTNIFCLNENIRCSREFHCTSMKQFPTKDLELYLGHILYMADKFFEKVETFVKPTESQVN